MVKVFARTKDYVGFLIYWQHARNGTVLVRVGDDTVKPLLSGEKQEWPRHPALTE